jgi:hypothetical protein
VRVIACTDKGSGNQVVLCVGIPWLHRPKKEDNQGCTAWPSKASGHERREEYHEPKMGPMHRPHPDHPRRIRHLGVSRVVAEIRLVAATTVYRSRRFGTTEGGSYHP